MSNKSRNKELVLPNFEQTKLLISQAIIEDLGHGDITTEVLIIDDETGRASIVAKEDGILAGVEVAKLVFLEVDPKLEIDILIADGATVSPGNLIARIRGSCKSILKAERIALNFLQHLSGIATETSHYIKAVEGLPVQITDTRKTTPALRDLEKYAVRVGGGKNHRMHLGDGVLIKDNHMVILRRQGLSFKDIIARYRRNISPNVFVEIEVKTLQEAAEAVSAGADVIMLDNMSIDDMRRAVQLIKRRALIEASGGVTIGKVRAIAETGVNLISIGAITHSAGALDVSLELE